MRSWKHKVWAGVSVIAISFIVFWAGAYLLGRGMSLKSKKVVAARRTIAERSYALLNLSALKEQGPAAAAYQAQIDALVPPEDALLSYPEFLQGLARTQEVSIAFSFQGSANAPSASFPGYIGVSVTARGSPDRIRAFIGHIESQSTKFLTAVDSVEVVAEGEGYRADIRGRTFFK